MLRLLLLLVMDMLRLSEDSELKELLVIDIEMDPLESEDRLDSELLVILIEILSEERLDWLDSDSEEKLLFVMLIETLSEEKELLVTLILRLSEDAELIEDWLDSEDLVTLML